MDLCSSGLRGLEGPIVHNRDPKNISAAFHQLGLLAKSEKEYLEAASHFQRSLSLARQTGDAVSSNLNKCHLGISLGYFPLISFTSY